MNGWGLGESTPPEVPLRLVVTYNWISVIIIKRDKSSQPFQIGKDKGIANKAYKNFPSSNLDNSALKLTKVKALRSLLDYEDCLLRERFYYCSKPPNNAGRELFPPGEQHTELII